ncbi:TPA: hypothetical protein N0F65_006806 [Lagenidium giganteum]|uniref:t-SNARE coiled-coil homology domain-containing protein n=1 Tax=Lagenidium giganteum TaxID=4803 RepID=A0AAV2ZEA6_9STRA|nr:TPA: hypothetical protein N0F65_006806 [Lagenidium giganteum]
MEVAQAVAEPPLLASLVDARSAVNTLQGLTDEIGTLVTSPLLKTVQDYQEQVTPKLKEATSKYQALSAFLQLHKKDHDKEYRALQRDYVKAMQALQRVQAVGAQRHEALCDSDYLASDKITQEDILTAKQAVLEAGEIAHGAIVIRDLFSEFGTMLHAQGKGIDQIEEKVEQISIEIGKGVKELEQAQRLQAEARQKYLIILCVVLLILTAIIVPIVITFAK